MAQYNNYSDYGEIILYYYKHPKNKEEMEDATINIQDTNPLCGDKVKIFIRLDAEDRIEKVTFSGIGCAISQATTSILTTILPGKTIKEVLEFDKEEFLNLVGIEFSPSRRKCALLGFYTVKKGLVEHVNQKKTL